MFSRIACCKRLNPTLHQQRAISCANNTQRWGLFGDIHFDDKGLNRTVEASQWIVDEFEAKGVTRVVCLGDVLNTREKVSVEALSRAMEFFNSLSEKFPVEIVLGNHDLALRHSTKFSSLDALSLHHLSPHVRLHKQPSFINVPGADGKDVPCIFLPYHENPAPLVDFLSKFSDQPPNDAQPDHCLGPRSNTLVFGHLSIHGAIQRFFSPELGLPRRLCEHPELRPAHFAGFKQVFSGHFHHYHRVGDSNIVYVGSPMQHHFGDAQDLDRGVVLLDPVSGQHEMSRNPTVDKFRVVMLGSYLREPEKASAQPEAAEKKGGRKKKEEKIVAESNGSAMLPRVDFSDLPFDPAHKRIAVRSPPGVSLPPAVFESAKKELLRRGAEDVLIVDPPIHSAVLSVGNQPKSPTGESAKLKPVQDLASQIDPFLSAVFDKLPPNQKPSESYLSALRALGASLMKSEQAAPKSAVTATDRDHSFVGQLQHVTIENFMGVDGTTNVPLGQMKDGVWLIRGPNGSGKSTILEAITWCLFGTFLRSDMRADDAVNERAGKDCRVRIDFANGVSVERFRKHKALGGSGVKVYKDGKEEVELERGTVAASQDRIEELLGIDNKTFCRCIVFGSTASQNFVKSDEATRRQIIEDVLGFSKFDNFLELAKQKLDELRASESAVRMRIENLRADRDKVVEARDRLTRQGDQLDVEVARLIEQESEQREKEKSFATVAADLRKEVETAEECFLKLENLRAELMEVEERRREVKRLEEKIADLEPDIAFQTSQVQMSEDRLKEKHAEVERIKMQTSQFETEQQKMKEERERLESTLRQVSQMAKFLKFLRDIFVFVLRLLRVMRGPPKPDPATLQLEALAKQLTHVEQALTEQETKLGKALGGIPLEEGSMETIRSRIRSQQQKLDEARERLNRKKEEAAKDGRDEDSLSFDIYEAEQEYNRHAKSALRQLASLGDQDSTPLANLSDFPAFQKRVFERVVKAEARLQLSAGLIKDRLDDKRRQRKAVGDELEGLRAESRISEMEHELSEREKDVQKLEIQCALHSFWAAAFSKKGSTGKESWVPSMRVHLMEHAITDLNALLREYAQALNLPDQKMTFLDAKLTLTGDFGRQSSGQRKRNELAMVFSLFELVRHHQRFESQFIALDESLDSLDVEGQESVRQVLNLVAARCAKVLVISHSQEQQFLPNVISVERSEKGPVFRDTQNLISQVFGP